MRLTPATPSPTARREAIAQAFRDAREPSVEERLTARLHGVERQVAELRLTVQDTAEKVREIDLTATEVYDDWPDEDSDLIESPTVPSLESPGLMSAVASQALFGHS
jgi:hypothetical protein